MTDAFNRVAGLRAEHTRERLGDYEKLSRIDQRVGRELQRALAEYRRLQERDLGDESASFVETNPPPEGEGRQS